MEQVNISSWNQFIQGLGFAYSQSSHNLPHWNNKGRMFQYALLDADSSFKVTILDDRKTMLADPRTGKFSTVYNERARTYNLTQHNYDFLTQTPFSRGIWWTNPRPRNAMTGSTCWNWPEFKPNSLFIWVSWVGFVSLIKVIHFRLIIISVFWGHCKDWNYRNIALLCLGNGAVMYV
jgi:hypothetical protein